MATVVDQSDPEAVFDLQGQSRLLYTVPQSVEGRCNLPLLLYQLGLEYQTLLMDRSDQQLLQ
jgi:hypothetical protein